MQSVSEFILQGIAQGLGIEGKALTIMVTALNMVFKHSSMCKEDETCQQFLQLRFWVSLNHVCVSEIPISMGKQLFGICVGNCGLILQD